MTFEEAEEKVTFTDIDESMVDMIADYFDPITNHEFWKNRNVNLEKLSPKLETKKIWTTTIQRERLEKKPIPSLAVLYESQAIGFHILTHIEGNKTARFHAHFCNPRFRGLGIALYTYPQVCKIFIHRFELEYIHFKTPINNIAPNRVKEKLKIPPGEVTPINDSSLMIKGTLGINYQLSLDQIENIISEQKKLNSLNLSLPTV